jgi:exodeoxyribonuclease-3
MVELRVLSYNLEFGGRSQLEAITALLAHVDADIVALTEADDRRVVETLATRLNLHHVWAEGSGDRHIATLSRFPIVDWKIYNRPPLTQAVLETRIGGLSGPLTIYNVHFLPYLLLPFEVRRWQAVGKLLALIRAKEPGAHLIVGDLNSIAPGDRVLQRRNPPRMKRVMALQLRIIFRLAIARLLRNGYVDCFRHLHPGEDGFTWNTTVRTTRYDYILADKAMAGRLRTCKVVEGIDAVYHASDHFPLLATFE